MVSAVSSSALILLFLVFVIFSGKLPSGGARTRNTAKIGKSLRALSKKAHL